MDWLSQSPELNPTLLYAREDFTQQLSQHQYKQIVTTKFWTELYVVTLHTRTQTMPMEICAVSQAKGRPT